MRPVIVDAGVFIAAHLAQEAGDTTAYAEARQAWAAELDRLRQQIARERHSTTPITGLDLLEELREE